MTLHWTVYEQTDGQFRVPAGSADGVIADGDEVYPSLREAIDDLYDAVIRDYAIAGRRAGGVRVIFEFVVEDDVV